MESETNTPDQRLLLSDIKWCAKSKRQFHQTTTRGRNGAELELSTVKLTSSVLTLVADILAQSADPSGTLVPKHKNKSL